MACCFRINGNRACIAKDPARGTDRVFENNGSPGRTRTYNSAVNSRVLYH